MTNSHFAMGSKIFITWTIAVCLKFHRRIFSVILQSREIYIFIIKSLPAFYTVSYIEIYLPVGYCSVMCICHV